MNNIKHAYILSQDTMFQDLVQAIESGGIGFLAIIDAKKELLGVVTDGDIRRCILNNKFDLNFLINKSPETWSHHKNEISAIAHLNKIHRRHLPIVDDKNYLIKIICLDDIEFKIIQNPVVLMAGGLGTRLHPLTLDKPKPMLPLNGKPMLEKIITKLISQGFRNFYLSINYKGEQIKEYFKDGSDWDINIQYIEETKQLGTAGALSKIKNLLQSSFVVMNGDIITDLDLSEVLKFHNTHKDLATMCIYKQTYQIPFGVIKSNQDNSIISIDEKPVIDYFINSGIYILDPKVCQYIPDNTFFDMPTLFQKLVNDHQKTKTYIIDGYWNDIGHLNEYNRIAEEGI